MHHSERTLCVQLADEAATQRLGAQLAKRVASGMRVYLSGPLGAGKTTLVRALLHGLGHVGRVKSPSYALVEPYIISSLYLYHFDFYRFRDPNEWHDSGFRELFASPAICLVEWPDKAHGLLPEPDLAIDITPSDITPSVITPGNITPDDVAPHHQGRRAVLTAGSPLGEQCVSALRSLGEFF